MSPRNPLAILPIALACAALGGCGDGEEKIDTSRAPLTAVCIDTAEDAPEDGWRCDELRIAECDHHDGAQVDFIYVQDPDGPICAEAALAVSDAGPYLPGVHVIEVTRVEGDGEILLCEATLDVVDTLPPEVETRTVELWPPNHKLHTITPADCVDAWDACDGDVYVRFTYATSDEPFEANGDGNTEPDIVDLGCEGVQLRAERQGGGDGRVYTLGWEAWDDVGNMTDGTCRVVVPHDQSDRGVTDSGEAEREDVDLDACEAKDPEAG